jgi:hypothetical protein
VSGTQEDLLKTAAAAYDRAKDALTEAERQPAGHSATRAVEAAKNVLNTATTTLDSRYTDYYNSMSRAGHTPRPKSDFINS